MYPRIYLSSELTKISTGGNLAPGWCNITEYGNSIIGMKVMASESDKKNNFSETLPTGCRSVICLINFYVPAWKYHRPLITFSVIGNSVLYDLFASYRLSVVQNGGHFKQNLEIYKRKLDKDSGIFCANGRIWHNNIFIFFKLSCCARTDHIYT